jgi:hypothetical protein
MHSFYDYFAMGGTHKKKKKVNHLPVHSNGMIHPSYGYPMGYPNHPSMMAPHSEMGESAAQEAGESASMQASEGEAPMANWGGQYAGGGITHAGHHFPGYNRPIADSDGKHKKVVLAKVGNKTKVVHFGAKGYSNNYSAKARAAYKSRHAGEGSQSKLTAGYWAYHNLWGSHTPANHAGRSSGHGERFAQDGGQMDMYANGGTNNSGFRALPDYVQHQILSNMAIGGEKMPPEIARARFAAAGNLDEMSKYGYAYGGYIPHMMDGGNQYMAEGGEPNGGMALGQMSAVADKMSKLRQFVSPDQNLDPWIASKLAVMDDSADAIADYMMYNPEAKGGSKDEEEMMAHGGEMIRRADGHYSRRGLWDNIRANKGSGKKPSKEMIQQEKKIRSKMAHGGSTYSNGIWFQDGGDVDQMANGGIHIKKSHEGKFTDWAKRHGMSMSEAIQAGKHAKSAAVRKMATFADNARHWKHAEGGVVNGQEMEVTPQEAEMLRQQGYQFDIIK